MSRHSTPSEAFGRLNLRESSNSTASSGMPVQTRSAKKRAGESSVRPTSSGGDASAGAAVAGPSRSSTRRRTQPSSSSKRTGKAPVRRVAVEEEDPDDDDDGDDDDREDDDDDDDNDDNPSQSFEGRKQLAIAEFLCNYTDSMLTPFEFIALRRNQEDGRE